MLSRMGTATVTRSKSRKPLSNCNTDFSERDLCSPLTIVPGNSLHSFSRRRTRRVGKDEEFLELENVPPSTGRLKEGKGLVNSSSQKFTKKRKKPAEEAIEGPVSFEGINAEAKTIESPHTIRGSVLKSKADAELTNNQASCEPYLPIELSSINGISKLQLQPRTMDIEKPNEEVVTGSMPQKSAQGLVEDQPKDVLDRPKGKDGGAEAILSTSSALVLLKNEYERLFSRYKKLKAQKLDEADALFNEQNSRIADFVQATEALLEFYKCENLSLKKQLESASNPKLLERNKFLEKANVDHRNEVLQEQSRSQELRQENKKLKSLLLEHIAEKQKHEVTEHVKGQGSQCGKSRDVTKEASDDCMVHRSAKLAQRVLESLLGLQISCPDSGYDEPHLHFKHCKTGFSFDIKEVHDKEIAEIVEGGELMYQNESLGVCRKAVDWMKQKELTIGMNQAQLFFKRLVGFLNRGLC